jgi:hypothetical protein
LDSFDRLFLLDPATLSFRKIVIVAPQDWLHILLEVLAQLADFFLQRLLGFGFRHPVFTCLSATKNALYGLGFEPSAALW